jgi:hypothetical protein
MSKKGRNSRVSPRSTARRLALTRELEGMLTWEPTELLTPALALESLTESFAHGFSEDGKDVYFHLKDLRFDDADLGLEDFSPEEMMALDAVRTAWPDATVSYHEWEARIDRCGGMTRRAVVVQKSAGLTWAFYRLGAEMDELWDLTD